MQDVEKELKSAQHLLYVSLKYTKTCDVILNLMNRWESIINLSMNLILQKLFKKKVIKEIPVAPKMKVDIMTKAFRKRKEVMDALILFTFFRKVPSYSLIREHEFRKNVALVITNNVDGESTRVDMEKLKVWEAIIENFIKFVRSYV